MSETAWLVEWPENGRIRYEPAELGVCTYDANDAQKWHSREAAERHLKELQRLSAGWHMARVTEHEWPDAETCEGRERG